MFHLVADSFEKKQQLKVSAQHDRDLLLALLLQCALLQAVVPYNKQNKLEKKLRMGLGRYL